MSKKTRKITVMLIGVMMCLVVALGLAACVDPEEENIQANTNTAAVGYINEVSTAIGNSLDADFQNGFNIGLDGSLKLGDDTYTFGIDANVLPKTATNNKDFGLTVKKNGTELVGLYNKGTNLYLSANSVNYNFRDASVMDALRYFIVTNVPAYNDLTNLGNIAIEGATLKSMVEGLLPSALELFSTDTKAEDITGNIKVTKEGNVITLNLFGDEIVGMLGGLSADLNQTLAFLKGVTLKLDVTVENAELKKIDVSATVNQKAIEFELNSKNNGLFGQVNDTLNITVPQALAEVPETSVLQTELKGKFNLLAKTDGTESILKSFDWKLVAKMDIFTLLRQNLVFSNLPEDNFFHFQLSHTCNDTCKAYCETNLMSAQSTTLRTNADDPKTSRHTKTSIIDIAFDADKSASGLGTQNLIIDVSVWDLLTQRAVETLISKAGVSLTNVGSMVTKFIPTQLALSIDLDAAVLKDNTVGQTSSGGETPEPPVEPAKPVDIVKLLTDLVGAVGLSDGALRLDVQNLTTMVSGLAGNSPILGTITVKDILDAVFDKDANTTGLSFTAENADFRNLDIVDYDVYSNAVKMNMNGKEKMFKYNNTLTAYGGSGFGGEATVGSPVLYVKDAEKTNGYLNVYKKVNEVYTLVASDTLSLTKNDWENNLKDLYFKYTYVDYNKAEQTAYGTIFGFQGLDLSKTEAQNVKMLPNIMSGEGFNTCVQKNVGPILAALGSGAGISIPNLETVIPIAGGAFDVIIKIMPNA